MVSRAIPILLFFYFSCFSLLLSPLLSTPIVAVITIFLRPPSVLSTNDLSIESRAGNHRTSTNGTANGYVLLVPLHLPHYTQFSAGDLIGFPLLTFPLRSSLPACSFLLVFPLFFHLRNRSKNLFLSEIVTLFKSTLQFDYYCKLFVINLYYYY